MIVLEEVVRRVMVRRRMLEVVRGRVSLVLHCLRRSLGFREIILARCRRAMPELREAQSQSMFMTQSIYLT